jgi:hypothetical protein
MSFFIRVDECGHTEILAIVYVGISTCTNHVQEDALCTGTYNVPGLLVPLPRKAKADRWLAAMHLTTNIQVRKKEIQVRFYHPIQFLQTPLSFLFPVSGSWFSLAASFS